MQLDNLCAHGRGRVGCACTTVSIDLLHPNHVQISTDLTERVASQTEAVYDDEGSAAEPISRFRLVSEELSGDAGAMYLREIAHHELLAAHEEVALARRLEAGKAAIKELAIAEDTLDTDQRAELKRLADDGEQARRRLIECNLRLVVSVARRYVGRKVSFLDLVQEGNMGLQIGVDKYDWRRGFRFSTYVYWWIRQSLTRAIADQSRTIRLPGHIGDLLSKLARGERELSAQYGRQPTVDELAQYLDVDPERINAVRRATRVPLSLEAPLGEDVELTRGDLIGDCRAAEAATDSAEAADLSVRLEAALDELEPRERQVLRLRFGLNHRFERTLTEVGDELGVSRERIRQIEAGALAKLRRMPRLRQELLEYIS